MCEVLTFHYMYVPLQLTKFESCSLCTSGIFALRMPEIQPGCHALLSDSKLRLTALILEFLKPTTEVD